jgi:hypothetical protein
MSSELPTDTAVLLGTGQQYIFCSLLKLNIAMMLVWINEVRVKRYVFMSIDA